MAKNKRHIDLELKAKLGTHTVPVTESDWTAFESFSKKKGSKRRGLIYLIAATLVFVGVMGMLVWKFQDPNSNIENATRHPEQANEVPADAESERRVEGRHPEQANEVPADAESERRVEVRHPEQANEVPADAESERRVEGRHPEQANELPVDAESPRRVEGENTPRHPEQANDLPDFAETPRRVEGPGNITPFVFYFSAPALNQTDIPAVVAYEKAENKDTGKAGVEVNPKSIGMPFTPSLALGLVYGFGKPEMMLGDIDSARTHRQYENTLKDAKQSSQVFRLNMQYEYRMKFGVEFGAGLQFSSVTQVQKYSFEMREIPYIDTDGTILFYIPIPPNQAVTPTVFESKQTIMSASVPMSVGYAHNLGKNFRFGARAQGSFGMNWSKDFNGLSPNTLSETNLKANVNPLNMSYGGGLFGEYFYLRTWSARVSVDWTAQNKLYKQSNSFNAINRYYEFKLALVRYL